MTLLRNSGGAAAIAIALCLGAPGSQAGVLDWIRLPGVCYDHDPYDTFQQYGKYYPYSGERCRQKRSSKQVSEAKNPDRGLICKRTNIRNHSSGCRS